MKHFVPSWQKPGTWLENIIALEPFEWIDGIELLFFEWNDDVRSSFARELPAIQAFTPRFEFSLHLPDPLEPAALDLVEMTTSFVQRYVFHPPLEQSAGSAFATISMLEEQFGAGRFLMEFTGEPSFSMTRDALPGISVCADTGCLLRTNLDPAEWISHNAESIREIHLHGCRDGKDHKPLDGSEAWLSDVARFSKEHDVDVVHELFSLDATTESHNVFRRFLP
jgi:hypothetical protein